MFEQIFAFVEHAWGHFTPAFVVRQWQLAAILRLGRYHRTVEPGLRWKIPLLEEAHVDTAVTTTIRLAPQTVTTKDGRSAVVSGVLRHRLEDMEKYIRNVYDQEDVLVDTAMGAVLRACHEVTFDELVSEPPEAPVLATIRKKVKSFGFKIEAFTFTDIGAVRSIRLIQGSARSHHVDDLL